MPIPESVTHDELRAALEPFYDLLGVMDINIYDTPALVIGGNEITFVVPATIESAGPEQPRAFGRAIRLMPDHPHPQESKRDTAELAYVVTVKVDRP